ncbi:MAG TPA: hypothetical protein PKE12_03825 [Kiritimatiellia bacterium]|nr:hypothetical protein [Kiritimatiellia bacterium]
MTPFLDSLVIMMSLICLVLIVMIMPIIQNPKQLNVLSFEKLFKVLQRKQKVEQKPIYIDCRYDGATVIPGDITVTIDDLRQPGNAIERVMARVEASNGQDYIVLLARPGSLAVYRHLRKELIRRGIVAGADVLDAKAVLDWKAEMKELNITIPEY